MAQEEAHAGHFIRTCLAIISDRVAHINGDYPWLGLKEIRSLVDPDTLVETLYISGDGQTWTGQNGVAIAPPVYNPDAGPTTITVGISAEPTRLPHHCPVVERWLVTKFTPAAFGGNMFVGSTVNGCDNEWQWANAAYDLIIKTLYQLPRPLGAELHQPFYIALERFLRAATTINALAGPPRFNTTINGDATLLSNGKLRSIVNIRDHWYVEDIIVPEGQNIIEYIPNLRQQEVMLILSSHGEWGDFITARWEPVDNHPVEIMEGVRKMNDFIQSRAAASSKQQRPRNASPPDDKDGSAKQQKRARIGGNRRCRKCHAQKHC